MRKRNIWYPYILHPRKFDESPDFVGAFFYLAVSQCNE